MLVRYAAFCSGAPPPVLHLYTKVQKQQIWLRFSHEGMIAGYLAASRIENEAERQKAIRAFHQEGANELLRLCFANGGIYIKLGQHVGQLVRTSSHHKGLDYCVLSNV